MRRLAVGALRRRLGKHLPRHPRQHWALLLEGFPLEHKAVRLGLEAMEQFEITDVKRRMVAILRIAHLGYGVDGNCAM